VPNRLGGPSPVYYGPYHIFIVVWCGISVRAGVSHCGPAAVTAQTAVVVVGREGVMCFVVVRVNVSH